MLYYQLVFPSTNSSQIFFHLSLSHSDLTFPLPHHNLSDLYLQLSFMFSEQQFPFNVTIHSTLQKYLFQWLILLLFKEEYFIKILDKGSLFFLILFKIFKMIQCIRQHETFEQSMLGNLFHSAYLPPPPPQSIATSNQPW